MYMAIYQAWKQGQRSQINHPIPGWDLILGHMCHNACVFNEKRCIGAIVFARSIEDLCGKECLFHVRYLPIRSYTIIARQRPGDPGAVTAVARVFWGTAEPGC